MPTEEAFLAGPEADRRFWTLAGFPPTPREGSRHTGMLRPALSPGRTLRPSWELAQVAGGGGHWTPRLA